MKNYFLVPVFFIALAASAQSNYAVSFDGVDDYVSVPHNAALNLSNFSFEAWINLSSASGALTILSKGDGTNAATTNYIFNVGGSTNNSKLGLFAGGAWYSANTALSTGVWYHAAVTVSGTSVAFYLNGMADGTATLSGSMYTGGTYLFKIGEQGDGCNCNHMNGKIDEVRVWNIAITQQQIKTNMFNKNLSNSASGLVGYYRFNEGSGTSTVNTCTNTTGVDGTLTNGPTWSASPIQFAGNALSFDGVDDYVVSTATFNLNMNNSSFTVEAWINSGNTSANTSTERILMQWGSTWQAGSYQLVCTNSYINFNFNGSSTGSCTYNVNWQDGNWHHVAGVFDISTYTLYLYYDGVQEAAVSTAGHAPGNLNTSLYIGGSPSVANSFASAKIDEVRVWNVARSQSEIQANMSNELNYPFSNVGTVPRLYYIFNQGIAGGDNTGLTPAIEQYLQAHGNGTLVNFALSGGSSNYVTQNSSLFILPLKWLSFSAQKQNKTVLLQWRTASEINTSNFVVERSGDERNWNAIGTVLSKNNNSTNNYRYTDFSPVSGMNYYRMRQNDNDGRYSYSKIVGINIHEEAKPFKLASNLVVNKSLQLEVNSSASQIITLLASDGKIIWSKKFVPGTHSVNLNALSHGVYILESGSYSEKILLQ